MQYRKVGDSGLYISAVSLGGWINFGEGKVRDEVGQKVIETAYEQGINFFDLADAYGRGEAERQVGEVLANYPRQSLVISTKVYWPMSDDVNDRGLSRKHILESIEKSLDRLGVDYVDLYFCHRPDPETSLRETVQAMNTLVEQGMVLYWGTSVWPAEQIEQAYELCDRYGWHLPKIEQPQYSMLYRQPVESEILPVAERLGIGLVVFSPLAMGMLTGKYDNGVPDDTRFSREPWAKERFLNEETVEKVRKLEPVARRLGISRSQLALAWVLRQPTVSSVITGATQPEQVLENVQAAEVELDGDAIGEIEEIVGETEVVG